MLSDPNTKIDEFGRDKDMIGIVFMGKITIIIPTQYVQMVTIK